MKGWCGPLVAALTILVATSATAADGDELTSYLWMGRGGPEEFYWEVWRDGDGYDGVVHTVRDGKKQTELPVTRVVWQAPAVELHMDATGVVFRGRVEPEAGRIAGRLYYGGEEGPVFDLHRVAREQVPVLLPRPTDAPPWTYRIPTSTGDGWETGDCAAYGLPRATVVGIVNDVCAGEAGVIHSLLVVAGGRLVVEEYFHGYGRDDLHRLASVTKSVSSLLVGVAVDRSELAGTETPVIDFFGDLDPPADPRWREVTLHHLLSMSMGLDWGPDENPHGTGPEFFAKVLARRFVHEPGTHWAYHSPNINLLAGVLHAATGLHADVFAERHLFRPLGITDYDWSYRASDGYRLMDGSLHLRPRDMAKLGMLLRDEGHWHGEQVVSAAWIRRATSPHMSTDGPQRYGYLWWLGELASREGAQSAVYASGLGSQFIVWFPARDLVLVVTGGNEDNGKHFAIAGLLGRHL